MFYLSNPDGNISNSQRNSSKGVINLNTNNSVDNIISDINKITSNNPQDPVIGINTIQILSKPIENKKFILASSTINSIKSLQDLIADLVIFDSLTYDVFMQIFYLIDYYIFASLKMFMDKKYFAALFEEINIEEVRKKARIEQAMETILYQKRFSKLRRYLLKTKRNFENLFEIEIDISQGTYDNNNDNYEMSEFYLPKINPNIIINDTNVYSCMIESIILYESFVSMKIILKRLSHFTNKIELEFRSKFVLNTINDYKEVIEELKVFIYKPICANIFKVDPIYNKIMNYRWDPKDTEASSPFSEANTYVDTIFQEICEKYDKLYLLSGGSLTEKSQKRFLDVMLVHITEKLIDTFSKIKKFSSYGRSILLKDIKFLKSKIESKFSKE